MKQLKPEDIDWDSIDKISPEDIDWNWVSRPLQYAREHNLPKYFTGKPCKQGHIGFRSLSKNGHTSGCIICIEERERIRKEVTSTRREIRADNPSIRQLAIINNLPRYFTGNPCINGHIAERYTKKTTCVECEKNRKNNYRTRIRAERKELVKTTGKNKYFSGEPCPKGHIALRYVVNNRCVECHTLERKRYSKPLTYEQKEEAKRLRAEATVVRKAKKAVEQKALLLTVEENEIVSYARDCLRALYPYNHGGSYRMNGNIAEYESGYSKEELIDYLSDASNVRTRWGTYKNNNYWHVDHKIPLSKMVKKGMTEIWNLNALDNLRLIRANKNLQKGAKVSEKKLLNYLEIKYQQNPTRLGLYNPSERSTIIINKVAKRVFTNLTSSISNTPFFITKSENAIKHDINYDLEHGGVEVWTHREKPTVTDINKYLIKNCMYQFLRGDSSYKIAMMLLSSYAPLKSIRRLQFEQFKYKDDCVKYYDKLIRNEDNELCKEYLKLVSSNNCKNCKPKGFFKMLSEI